MNKLNVGCGAYLLPGYTNLDPYHDNVDLNMDFFTYAAICEPDIWDEVRADHVLEHVGRDDGLRMLMFMHMILKPGGKVVIEVPDMVEIMFGNTGGFEQMQCIYGSQEHGGAYHKWGYTIHTLYNILERVGFKTVTSTAFISDHPARSGFPSLIGVGVK